MLHHTQFASTSTYIPAVNISLLETKYLRQILAEPTDRPIPKPLGAKYRMAENVAFYPTPFDAYLATMPNIPEPVTVVEIKRDGPFKRIFKPTKGIKKPKGSAKKENIPIAF